MKDPFFESVQESPKANISKLSWPYCYEIKSNRPGPVVSILGSIHGDELCGHDTIKNLLQDFASGKLSLVAGVLRLGLGNLAALEAKNRYCEFNLNRLFRAETRSLPKSYEVTRAIELMDFLQGTDVLFDLHSTTEPSEPFLLCENFVAPDGSQFSPFPIVTGWCSLGDASVAGDTESYVNSLGGKSYTFESGWKDWPGSSDCAYEMSIRMLTYYGLIKGENKFSELSARASVFELFAVQNLLRPDMRYSRKFKTFDPLSAGELIASDSDQEFRAPCDCVIVMPANPAFKKPGEDVYFLARRKTF
jgi:predicted deacylase